MSLPERTEPAGVVIVGTGHAGAQAAIALRQLGDTRPIMMIGEEPGVPYERPPLSKDYLAGAKTSAQLLIRPAAFWTERDVTVIDGERVTAVDAAAHRVRCVSGRELGYEQLIWAGGGRARKLGCAGAELRGLHAIRCRADVDALRLELAEVEHVVIIGGGYIGLEAAAVLSKLGKLGKLGKAVTVLEAMDRVLARVAGEPLSRFYEAEHRAHGVIVRTGVSVESIEGRDGRVSAVRLADGERVAAEILIVGIGIIPNVEPLIEAGADGGNGVRVDATCRTSLADIWAVGDCALHANRFADGADIRLESVQNANDQATTAARDILGHPAPYHATPWFWSNQYDLKLQTVGLSTGFDRCVVRGDPATRRFSVVYLRDDAVVALDCVNAVRDYVQGKALVEARLRPDLTQLADPDVPLKFLLPTEK